MAGPAALAGFPDRRTRYRWQFWSDHKGAWYAGTVTLFEDNERDAMRAFERWLPFKAEE